MQQIFLQKQNYEQMLIQLSVMSKDDINHYLHELGCTLRYQDIYEQLLLTYNDLAVSDRIFETDNIQDEHAVFPKEFIDEAVLEIAKRESFPFTHYGIISSSIHSLMQEVNDDVSIALLDQYRLLFKMAKHFHLSSLEAISYQINDGVDMLSATMTLLDTLMYRGHQGKETYKEITIFVDKFLSVFSKTSDVFRISLLYEQAQAYIALKSKKGEQLFQQLLKTHSDVTDVVLHYGLAYIDNDERRAFRIFERYQSILNKDSEAYVEILELIKECKL